MTERITEPGQVGPDREEAAEAIHFFNERIM